MRDSMHPRRFLRFLFVGTFATALYFFATTLLSNPHVGMPMGMASLAGFALSLLASYLGHARITFQIEGDHARHALRYGIVVIGLVGLLSWLSHILVVRYGADRFLIAAFVAIVYPPSSFILHSFWSFAHPQGSIEP